MPSQNTRTGFSILEVLIVIVVMAVLAFTIIPYFTRGQLDVHRQAKVRLQDLRGQLELYRMQHQGSYPTGAGHLQQLSKATDVDGNVSPTGLPDAEHPLGPYVIGGRLPAQPFSGRNDIRIDRATAGSAPEVTPGDGGGWIYRPASGELFLDHPEFVVH